MTAVQRYVVFTVTLFAVLGALLVAPTTTVSKPSGEVATVLGQAPDSAAAAGSIYYRRTAGSMYIIYERPYSMWYKLYAGDRITGAISMKPMPGFQMRWHRTEDEITRTARCNPFPGICSSVPVYGEVIITSVTRL